MTSFIICTVIEYYFGDQIKEDEPGWKRPRRSWEGNIKMDCIRGSEDRGGWRVV